MEFLSPSGCGRQNEVVPVHSHPFAVHARVTAGEMSRDPFAALDAPALPPVPQP
jgi:hypothetical protein